MADYDPADVQQGPGWSDDSGESTPEGPHGTAQHSDSNDQNQQLDTPAANGDTEDAADYDPESASFLDAESAPKPLNPSPQPASKKPRTAGGFLVGDSDDESDDDDAPAPGGNAKGKEPAQPEPPLKSPPASSSKTPPGVAQATLSPQTASAQAASSGSDLGGAAQTLASASAVAPTVSYDPLALLEQRVKEDPRGALDAWQSLIAEYRRRNNIEQCRDIFERFLEVFPHSAEIWTQYVEMELAQGNFVETENIFSKILLSVQHVQLWTVYLDYIRRRNDLNDPSGKGRQVVGQAYDFVLGTVGFDKDAGRMWSDYIQFIRLAPGNIGGPAWQDQQKMDMLRKAFQKAVCNPISNVNILWKEYDQFEKGLNPTTGRKFLNERSPAYMTAKSANTGLENITRGLNRTTLPRLPPAPGFEGDQEYAEQVELWKRWICWEKDDNLDLASDEPDVLQKRILYAYRQAVMALRFWPEMWVDAAEWCFENNVKANGKDAGLTFLTDGIEANPESVLLALKHADRIEATHPVEEGEEAKIKRGDAVKAPYNEVLNTLYTNIKKLKEREKAEIEKLKESMPESSEPQKTEEDDDAADGPSDKPAGISEENQLKISALEKGYGAQTELLARTVSFVWIALARAMRRIQGKGSPAGSLGGMRQVFSQARARGRLTSDVYVAIAQMEWQIYKDPAGAKIFEKGSKLFPEDEYFMLEYIKFLHSRDDFTNARVVFETCVNKLTQQPALVHKAKPLCSYFYKYEAQFGELSQVSKLEQRMSELFPEDPKLAHFAQRFASDRFDPIAARIIVSPAAQLRPKMIMPSIELSNNGAGGRLGSPSAVDSLPARPRSPWHGEELASVNSPKRPLPADDFEDNLPPRKMQRGGDQREFQREKSPLKGAAGRRLAYERRMQGGSSSQYGGGAASAAPPIPRDVTFLLSQIPGASSYNATHLPPSGLVGLLQKTPIPDFKSWNSRPDKPARTHNRQASSDFASYGRRDSPGLGPGRTGSPFGLASASDMYRRRPDSRGSYEPPPPAPPASFLPPQFGVPPPGPQLQGYESVLAGAPPPGAPWAPPPQPGYAQAYPHQQPPPAQPPYGGYKY